MGETSVSQCLLPLQHGAARPLHAIEPQRARLYAGIDNERVRGWRLVLEPGETAPPSLSPPRNRIVLDGSEIAELLAGEPDRGMNLRTGEFYWQDAGTTRAIKNTGTARLSSSSSN